MIHWKRICQGDAWSCFKDLFNNAIQKSLSETVLMIVLWDLVLLSGLSEYRSILWHIQCFKTTRARYHELGSCEYQPFFSHFWRVPVQNQSKMVSARGSVLWLLSGPTLLCSYTVDAGTAFSGIFYLGTSTGHQGSIPMILPLNTINLSVNILLHDFGVGKNTSIESES